MPGERFPQLYSVLSRQASENVFPSARRLERPESPPTDVLGGVEDEKGVWIYFLNDFLQQWDLDIGHSTQEHILGFTGVHPGSLHCGNTSSQFRKDPESDLLPIDCDDGSQSFLRMGPGLEWASLPVQIPAQATMEPFPWSEKGVSPGCRQCRD